MNENPYASPLAASSQEAPSSSSSAESIRKEFIAHEASVKSIGLLYMLGAFFMVFGGLAMLGVTAFGNAGANGNAGAMVVLMLISGIYVGLGILQGATAIGLRKLQTWARYVAVVFSVIGLIVVPIGTLISGYFLYLLLSQKGTMVFSDKYKQIILETPHIKYKTSIVVVILLGLLLLVIVGGLLSLVLVG
jgi:hypothetical protein